MSNILFLSCNEWSGSYETCKDLISRNRLTNTMLFDVKEFLKRKHYTDKIAVEYPEWVASLSDEMISQMFGEEIPKRLSVNEGRVSNVIVTGNLSYEDIAQIVATARPDSYKTILVHTENDLLYSNYTLKMYDAMEEDKFVQKVEAERTKLGSLLSMAENGDPRVQFFYQDRNFAGLDREVGKALGFENLKYAPIMNESYIWPIEPRYMMTEHDKYGIRDKHMILGRPKFHSGFDITARTQTPVKATASGKVTFAGLDERIFSGQSKFNHRYGYMVEIVDFYGRKAIYAHLRDIAVQEGDTIAQGDLVGHSGCSGGARVPHLHFEIRRTNTKHAGAENTINPLSLMPAINEHELTERFDEEPYAGIWEKMTVEPFGVTDEQIPYAEQEERIR